jgi:hypothetical protein
VTEAEGIVPTVSSEYDAFWLARLEEIQGLIGDAAQGRVASADFSCIKPLGERASWAGTASIRGTVVVKVAMAHLTSLARIVADAGLCAPWPDQTFVFSMSTRGVLTVRPQWMRAPSVASSAPISVKSFTVETVQPTEEESLDPAEACREIHDVVTGLPEYTDPGEVPIANGLYFFFELGEDSPHRHPRITGSATTRTPGTVWCLGSGTITPPIGGRRTAACFAGISGVRSFDATVA